MKNLFLIACLAFATMANAQTFPAPSPAAKTYQMVGLTEVEVDYSSPGVKGRQVFGDLLPFGELWRTGANMATKISFSNPVVFGGKDVPAGTYALFTIPMEDKISVMLNSESEQGGTGSYSKEKDVATVSVPFNKMDKTVERMRFMITNASSNGAELTFEWADRTFVVPFIVRTDEQVGVKFKEKMSEYDNQFNTYNQAANYYFDSGDMEKAMEMSEKSVSMNAKFWNVHTMARIYAKQGNKEKAMMNAKKSMELAQAADNKDYVRLNEKLIADLK